MQLLLDSIKQRLESKFPYYSDLTKPVILAIQQMKYGLPILLTGSQDRKQDSLNMTLASLINFCTIDPIFIFKVCSVVKFMKLDGRLKLNIILSLQSKLSSLCNAQKFENKIIWSAIRAIFDDIVDLWTNYEKGRLEKLQQAESMYKATEHHIQSQDELDAEEFKEQFPDFAEEFENSLISIPSDHNEILETTSGQQHGFSKQIKRCISNNDTASNSA
jgi:hypothetical protein